MSRPDDYPELALHAESRGNYKYSRLLITDNRKRNHREEYFSAWQVAAIGALFCALVAGGIWLVVLACRGWGR